MRSNTGCASATDAEYDNELYGILRHGRILAVKAPWPEEATDVHDERAPWEQLGRAMPGSPEDHPPVRIK